VTQAVAGRVMTVIVVKSVDTIRNFYVDSLGFNHVMGMVGKDGQLDFCTVVMGEARIMFMRAPGEVPSSAAWGPTASSNGGSICPTSPELEAIWQISIRRWPRARRRLST
jgi:hypothetical protein